MNAVDPSRSETPLDYAQSIIDTVRDPMLVLDGGLRVITASRTFCQTFQVSAAETEGSLVYELGNGQWNIPRLRELLEIILPEQTSFDAYEVTHDFPSIGTRTMLLNARKVWRSANNSHRVLLAIEDISKRKEIEIQLAAVSAELRRSNEDLEQFARVAGHDLRAPINTMVQFSQLLERRLRDTLDEQCKMYLNHIIEGGRSTGQLLTELLNYARVAQDNDTPTQTASLQEACGQAKANLNAAINDSLAEITCNIPPDAGVQIEFNRLVQVLQNLIGNAIHYRDDQRRASVEVTAQLHGTLWQISVRDNGVGIDKQFFQTVFEPFRRLHGKEKPGTGIGLATCKRAIERAEGTIWLDSTLGQGSTFFIELPKAV